MNSPQAEPWLRGPIPGVDPLVAPVFASFAQVREDLAAHTKGLSDADVWRSIDGIPALGFQLRHIAGSVERLTAYLMGGQLTNDQIAVMQQEGTPEGALTELLAGVDAALARSEHRLKTLDPASIYGRRSIGRKRLPSTVIGLIVHLAEHTQRHLGQAITTTKLLGTVKR